MNPFLRILLGIIMSGVGYTMVRYTDFYMSMIGRIAFAERNFTGGSRFFYKLVGLGVILMGIIVTTNLWDLLIGSFLRGIFGA